MVFRQTITTTGKNMKTYKIIKFKFNGTPRVIKRGLTLEQAQAHCQRDDTQGEGWFHGYDSEDEE
jgi:hypothetical protein